MRRRARVVRIVDEARDAGIDAAECGGEIADVYVLRLVEGGKAAMRGAHVVADGCAVGNNAVELALPGVAVAIDHPGMTTIPAASTTIVFPPWPAPARSGPTAEMRLPSIKTSPTAKSPTPVSIEMMVPPRITMRRPLSPAVRRSRSSVASAPALP